MEEHETPLDPGPTGTRTAADAGAMRRAADAVETSQAPARERDALVHTARAFMLEQRAPRESSRELLRATVVSYTEALRARGEPPERALVLVKAAVEPVLEGAPEERRALMATVVRWCVEAYYAG